MTTIAQLELELKLLSDAAEGLVAGFDWGNSPQGAEYWCEAFYNIQNMIADLEQKISDAEETANETSTEEVRNG